MNAVTPAEVMAPPTPSNAIEFAGILGGISANIANLTTAINSQGDKLDKFDERLRKVETTVETLQATKYVERPRAPWYSVVAAVVGIVTGLGAIITLMVLMNELLNR